ncbi:unnamed protein product [Diamesa serratosioi]
MNSMQFDKIQASILNAYKIGITYGNAEKYQDTSDFELKIQKLCELEQGLTSEPLIIGDLPTVGIEELDAIYEKKIAEAIKKDPKDCNRYQSFVKEVEDIKYSLDQHISSQAQKPTKSNSSNEISEDCDLEIATETDFNFIDPITKLQIANPVRNKNCNHVYDLNSITSAIGKNRKMRCPYIGCSSRAYLTVANLVEDRELKRKILMQNLKDNQ